MIANIIGYVLSIAGIILSFYLGKKSIKQKYPVYSIKSITLIDVNEINVGDLSVKYKQSDISSLTRTTFMFANIGKEIIKKEDISVNSPLVIDIGKNGEILKIERIKTSRKATGVEIKNIDRNAIEVTFDYLDYNDYFAMTFLHSDFNRDGDFNGDIAGAKNHKIHNALAVSFTKALPLRILSGSLIFISLIMAFVDIFTVTDVVELLGIKFTSLFFPTLSIQILAIALIYSTKFIRDRFIINKVYRELNSRE